MAPGLERINIHGPNKLPMALRITNFPEVFVPPQGQDLFRKNLGLMDIDFKAWLCSDSNQVHTKILQIHLSRPADVTVGRVR
jgi:hypothetical protein